MSIIEKTKQFYTHQFRKPHTLLPYLIELDLTLRTDIVIDGLKSCNMTAKSHY